MKKIVRIHYAISEDMKIFVERILSDAINEAYLAKDGESNGAYMEGREVRWWLIKAEWDDATNEVVRWL